MGEVTFTSEVIVSVLSICTVIEITKHTGLH